MNETDADSDSMTARYFAWLESSSRRAPCIVGQFVIGSSQVRPTSGEQTDPLLRQRAESGGAVIADGSGVSDTTRLAALRQREHAADALQRVQQAARDQRQPWPRNSF